jgi:hypothetical protein
MNTSKDHVRVILLSYIRTYIHTYMCATSNIVLHHCQGAVAYMSTYSDIGIPFPRKERRLNRFSHTFASTNHSLPRSSDHTTSTPSTTNPAIRPSNAKDAIRNRQKDKKTKTYNRRDSQMVTHSSTSRPVQCLCMAERTGCPVLTDLWSYVLGTQTVRLMKNWPQAIGLGRHRK